MTVQQQQTGSVGSAPPGDRLGAGLQSQLPDPPHEPVSRAERRAEARAAWRSTGVGWRVFPRTLIGISLTLAALGIGAGISGAVLFAYYDSRVADNTAQLAEFNAGLDQRVDEALTLLDDVTSNVSADIDAALGPYRLLLQNAEGVAAIGARLQGSVVLVETRDPAGADTIGSAVAVGRQGDITVLLTSLSLVRASTSEPGPGVRVVVGDQRVDARVFDWDDDLDVAVLTVGTPLEPVALAPVDEAGALTGQPVYAVSGFQATASPGTVLAVNASGIRYLALLARDFTGSPLVDSGGRLVGLVTPGYAPGGLDGDLRWSPSMEQVCANVVRCSGTDVGPR
jgi:hypothetical protein